MDECDTLLATFNLPSFQRLPPATLHLSLSRCIPLRHHHISPFTSLLTAALTAHALPAVPVPLLLSSLALYCNEQRTRSFAAMRVDGGSEAVLSVLEVVNGVMREMGLQTFYERPELHVTYAWRLGDVWQEQGRSCSSPRATDDAVAEAEADELECGSSSERDTRFDRPTVASCLVDVSAIHCKVGNRLTVIPLAVKR